MDSEVDLEYQLTQDFLFFMDIVKAPEQVFECNSRECKVARAWLDKMSTSQVDTIEELRMRNVYMSNLVACLNYGKLTGPFAAVPKSGPTLEPADFTAAKPRRVCPPAPVETATEAQKLCISNKSPLACECEYVCCDDGPNAGQAGGGTYNASPMSPYDNFCGYVTTHVNVPSCMDGNLDSSLRSKLNFDTKETACAAISTNISKALHSKGGKESERSKDKEKDSKRDEDSISTTTTTISNVCNRSPTLVDQYEMYDHITVLLDAIASELRGEATPGSNDYLECELARYKNFIMNYSNMACVLLKLQAKPTLRSFLLLNLQIDLVKLVSDRPEPIVDKERAFGCRN